MFRTLKEADAVHGGFSRPSKMPGYAYSIPARNCLVGAELRKIPGSVCSTCYALKGRYVFPTAEAAMQRRLKSLTDPRWVDAMAFSINGRKCEYFRWHDSGDLQGMWHLINIVKVAQLCLKTKFWMPTREQAMVSQYMETIGGFPANLVVRVSGAMINGGPPKKFFTTSTVTADPAKATCPAPKQDGKCGECRACWNPKVKNVTYLKH